MAKKITKALITDEILNEAKAYTDASVGAVAAGNIYTGTTSTDPIPTGTVIYNVSAAGTYTNFLDGTATAIVVSSGDIASGIVQLRGVNDVFTKVIIPINLGSYATNEKVFKVRDSISTQAALSLTKVDNMYLNYLTGTPTSSSIREYAIISATELDNIQVSAWISGAVTAIAVYYGTAGAYLGYEVQGTASDVQLVKYRLNPPVGTLTIGITNKKSVGTMTVYKNTEIAFTTELNAIKSDITSLKSRTTIIEDTIKEKITPYYNIVEGSYYNYSTGVLTSSAVREYTEITVSDTDVILVTGTTNGALTALAVYFNGSTYIGYEFRGVDSVTTNYVEQKLTLPSGTTKIGITNYFFLGGTLEVNELIPIDYTERFNGIEEDIIEVNDRLKEPIEYSLTKVQDRYLRYSDGVEINPANTLREYAFITADPTKSVIVNAWVSGSQTALAVYYDSSDVYIGYEGRGTDGVTTDYLEYKLTIPPDTAKIGVTNLKASGTMEAFHLEDINFPDKFADIESRISNKVDFSTKTFVIFGDSITDGRVNGQTFNWVDVLKDKLNITPENLLNFASPGARYAAENDTDLNGVDPTYLDPVNNVGWNQINTWEVDTPDAPDYLFVALGTNDIEQQYTIGTYTSAFAQNLASTTQLTMCNAARKLIQRLQIDYETSKIIILCPIQGKTNYRTYDSIKTVSDELVKIAKRLGAYYIDCSEAFTNEYETYGSAGRYTLDGTHPNPNGGELHGEYVVSEFLNRVKY